ncbi:Protein of unknown function [Gryllus bimaculatus]|nr:Protein of unknown function [Gryllus bimaculatus]
MQGLIRSENKPIQRDFKDSPSARYLGMGRGRPGPSYERQDRGVGVRRREVSEKVSRFRDMIRPRSPK